MKLAALAGLLAALSATAATAEPVDKAYTSERSTVVPIRAGTGFDAALRCMDDMLSRTGYGNNYDLVPSTLMEPKADVGAATRDMIVTSASRMSEKSRFFRIRPFLDPNNLPTQAMLFVHGSITQYDKAVSGSGTGGGFGAEALGIGLRSQRQDAVLTVSLYFTTRDGVVVPGTTESVSMALTQTDKGGDLTGEIGSLGGFFELDFTHSDGIQQAARALIDLAMIQAVGTYAQVPYQRCLTLRSTDPTAIQAARKAFDKMKTSQQIHAIAAALAERGLLAEPSPGAMDQSLREAIADYQAQQGLPPLGLPTFEVYYALLQNTYGAVAAPGGAPLTTGAAVKVSPSGPGIRIRGDGNFSVLIGDRVTAAVTVVRRANVACFYSDGLGRTTKIFPNLQRASTVLEAGETLLLPGPQDIYTIEPDTPGSVEFITCLAGEQPFIDQLPLELRSPMQPGVAPLPVSNVQQLVTEIQRSVGEPLSISQMTYVVCASPNIGCPISSSPPAPSLTPRPAG